MAQTVYTFVPPHNPGYYPPIMGTAQEQALGKKRFQQNQALFRRYAAVNVALKKQIVTAVQLFSPSPRVDHLTGFGQVSVLQMIKHLFTSYREIYKINLKENTVKMMGPYDPAETLARLINQLEIRIEFLLAGEKTIYDAIKVSKVVTLFGIEIQLQQGHLIVETANHRSK